MTRTPFHKYLFMAVCIMLSGFTYGQENWSLRKQQDEMTIYTRARHDNPLKEYRINAIIHAPLEVVFDFLSDVSLHPEWVYHCSGLTIIEEQKYQSVTYHTSYDIPWPVPDRDLVARAVISWETDSSSVRILTEDIGLEYKLEKDVVRMPDYKEDVLLESLEDESTTRFSAEGFADPGGNFPPWLTNMFMVDGLYDSVIKTREWTENR